MSELLEDMKAAEARNEKRVSKYKDEVKERQKTIESLEADLA